MKKIITNLQKKKKTLIIIIGSMILISLVTTFGYFVINTNNERRMSADLQTGTMSLIFSDGKHRDIRRFSKHRLGQIY